MKISNAGINLIKSYEGFRREAYWDNGMYSIGYGHRDKKIVKGQTTNEQEAESWLRDDIASAEACIDRNFLRKGVQLSQSQFDACVWLAYNIGCSGFVNTDAAKALLKNDVAKFRKLLPNTKIGNYEGLKKRRTAELALFSGGAAAASKTQAQTPAAAANAGSKDWNKIALVATVIVGGGSLALALADFLIRTFKK